MKFKKLFILLSAFALCSCGEERAFVEPENEEPGQQEEHKEVTLKITDKVNFELEVEGTKQLEAELDGATGDITWTSSATSVATVDKTGKVTAVGGGKAIISASFEDVTDSVEVTVLYATWPEDDIKIVVQGIDESATDTIPAFSRANKITIDWQLYLDEGYFGIYCKTEDSNSVSEYYETLANAGWDIDSKVEEGGFYNAFSPRGQLWLNFGYNNEGKQLEIYATEGMFIHWPTAIIGELVADLIPDTSAVIPSIEATSYSVNTYTNILAIAINIYGLTSGAVSTYKSIVEQAGWATNLVSSNEYEAFSPDKKVKLDFYFDSYQYFNIDIFPYTAPSSVWPTEQASAVVSAMGLTGEVMAYAGTASGFEVDLNYLPPSIFVYVEDGTQTVCAAAYNQMLLNNGYELVGTMYGENVYGKPGTTLAYHATYLGGDCFTIELFNINQITPL